MSLASAIRAAVGGRTNKSRLEDERPEDLEDENKPEDAETEEEESAEEHEDENPEADEADPDVEDDKDDNSNYARGRKAERRRMSAILGGAKAEAETIGVPFLGEVPLTMSIRETSDAGTPVVVSEPEGPQARVYREIATKVWEQVKVRAGRAAPTIVFE